MEPNNATLKALNNKFTLYVTFTHYEKKQNMTYLLEVQKSEVFFKGKIMSLWILTLQYSSVSDKNLQKWQKLSLTTQGYE